jgi:hypothetical protein
MNPHELLLVLTALLGRRLERAPDSAPSSLRLARERVAAARSRVSERDPFHALEGLRGAPPSRPSHP